MVYNTEQMIEAAMANTKHQRLSVKSKLNGHPLKETIKAPSAPRQWNIQSSPAVAVSRNEIRSTLAAITAQVPTTSKAIVNLGLGDPTFYPLHPPSEATVVATRKALDSERANGYVAGVGTLEARAAVADYHKRWDGVDYKTDHIVLTHGVGHALELIFNVLLPHNSASSPANILLSSPGFPQYEALLATLGTEVRHYQCVEENGWEIDLEGLDALCDEETRAILITNPSNPCGSNFSRKHLTSIIDIAETHKVPIIADEIYGHMTYGSSFTPLASLSSSVPVLTLSGLSKRFLLPGWRFGWVALHDPLGVASAIKDGMAVWGNRIMGPNSLVQAALPGILATEPEWFQEVTRKIELNSITVFEAVQSIPGLSTTMPQGALYMLVRIALAEFPDFKDDADFCAALYKEEAVFVLPGQCFSAKGYFRVVNGAPVEVMRDVMERLRDFCGRHVRA
ncbi:tyrosine aminotransferase, partial [Tremellales sp. Uapishka_1]